jgi:hypothetical protein
LDGFSRFDVEAVSVNRITLFADIAGQRTREVQGSPRVTAAAVALPTAALADVRVELPRSLNKWKTLSEHMGREVVELLVNRSLVVAAATVNRDTDSWKQALIDEEVLHSQIASESGEKAGWAKLPVVLAYMLLSRACLLALTHFLQANRGPMILDARGLAVIECNLVCDEEFSGEENVEVFKSFWSDERVPTRQLASMGFRVHHPSVTLTTEHSERLLLLADVCAGLVHSAYLPDPGRVVMPLPCAVSKALLRPLAACRRLEVDAFDFDSTYDQIFGIAMQEARLRKSGRAG